MSDILYDYIDAIEFATRAHGSQTRKFGDQEPYIAHPIRASKAILQLTEDWGLERRLRLATATVLHDVLEDTKVNRTLMLNKFGTDITTLVESVTKNTALSKADKELDYLLRFKQSSLDTVLIKLADRLDNLHSMESAPLSFKKSYIANTKTLLKALPDAHKNERHVQRLKTEITKLLEDYERQF